MLAALKRSPADPYPEVSGEPYQRHCTKAMSAPAQATGSENQAPAVVRLPAGYARITTVSGIAASGARLGRTATATAAAMPADSGEPSITNHQQSAHAAVTGTSLIG